MKFTDAELSTISNALHAAQELYRENALTMRNMAGVTGMERLAQQLDRQAIELDELIERIATEEGL